MKRFLVYLFTIIIAIVSGHYLGNYCADSNEYVSWLAKSLKFGFDMQEFNLNVVSFTFGLHLSINFMQIFLIVFAIALSPTIIKSIK